jgi:hypothetical protein
MSAVAEPSSPNRWSWVSCPNPFYLLSAACVLHSSCWSLPARDSGMPPLIVPGLVAGYTLVLALTTLLVVRRWKVWDDARSMIVMLLILCVDLALIGDEWLIVSPGWGIGLLTAGFLFSVGITELIIRGLRLQLSILWRGPHYLQMALVFFWPCLVNAIPPDLPLRRGMIHWYFVITGVSFVLLWFAARRGPQGVSIPPRWKWPIHPWSLFVVNSFSCLARGFSMTLSLDPVFHLSREAALQQLLSIADWSFLTPMLLAWSVVVFECGYRSRNYRVQWIGQLLTLIGIMFSLPHPAINGAQAAHFQWLASLGINLWVVSLLGGISCCMWFDWRGSRFAGAGVVLGLIAIGVTDGRPSLVFLTVEHWSTWPLWLAAAWWAMRSATWKNSLNQFVAVALFLLPAYGERWFAYAAYAPEALLWRLLEMVVVLLAIRGVDPLARGLRNPVMLLAAVQSVGLLSQQWFGEPRLWLTVIDAWLIVCGTLAIAHRARSLWF